MFERGTELDMTFKNSGRSRLSYKEEPAPIHRIYYKEEPAPVQVVERVIVVQEPAPPRPKIVAAKDIMKQVLNQSSNIEDDRSKFKVKRESKQDREKRTAKNANSVMERQNRLRKEAAQKKKEEAMKRAQEMNGVQEMVYVVNNGDQQQVHSGSYKMVNAVEKIRVVKRFEI